jgi:NitT/TauT family transport system permease protein
MPSTGNLIDSPAPVIKKAAPVHAAIEKTRSSDGLVVRPSKWRAAKLLAVPMVAVLALAIHISLSAKEPATETRTYSIFLGVVLGVSLVAATVQRFWPGLRRWMEHMGPIMAAAILLLCVWEGITTGLRLLPLPYFPSPAGVLQSLLNDRALLFDSTWHSLVLLLSGYALGVVIALITGVCIGWYPIARYWGMPLLKVLGPIPATAWVPLAMVLSPSGSASAVGLVALAVWFPVSMLTISGIANTRASYLDVARTLGAGQNT